MTNPFLPVRDHPLAPDARDDGYDVDGEPINAIGFVEWDIASDRLIWDRGAEQRFGVPPGSMSSFAGWSSFVHPDDVQRIRSDAAIANQQGLDRMAYRYRFRPDDSQPWRLIEGVALCWFDETFQLSRMTGVALDITSSEDNRRSLEHSRAQMRAILETVPDALMIVAADGTIQSVNQAAERIFGATGDRLVGTPIAALVPGAMGGAPLAEPAIQLIQARRADGVEFPAEVSIGEAQVDGEQLLTCFVRDVSARVAAERRLEELRNQYLRTARLTAMGAVAAGLAHELNQPLAATGNFIAAATIRLGNQQVEDEALALLDQAGAQIKLAGDIIRRLRGFINPGEPRNERLLLPMLVDEAIALAMAGRDRQICEVEIADTDTLPAIRADRVRTLQILVNLLRNAADAMADAPQRTIRISCQRERNFARIAVADTGPGFAPDVLKRIDGGFVSPKEGEGMGLGLSICRRIVESWAGDLQLGNTPGGGGLVSFTVPIDAD